MALQDLHNIVFLMILKILIMITSFLKINKWNRLFHVFFKKKSYLTTPFGPNVKILLRTVQIYYERSRFYYERWRCIMKGPRFYNQRWVDIYYGRSIFCHEWPRFSWWQVEILSWTIEIFMITDRDFHGDRSRFYDERLTFSWWQVQIFIMAGWDYHDDRSRFSWW